jgi:hypothetical protein
MSFIPDSGVMHFPSLHPAVRQYVHLESSGARDGSGQNGWYYPVLFVNTFWQLRTSHKLEPPSKLEIQLISQSRRRSQAERQDGCPRFVFIHKKLHVTNIFQVDLSLAVVMEASLK